ncbi:hypothetical protein HUS23_06730 [Ectothiorhodospiraceae bacterium 2226]|nr:hypothetical protein HUS23_06730 [Ectothiorhodospiraceae bacterium 2226]
MKPKTYSGIYNDKHGGMTSLGAIIKDGWILGLIPETETGEGWSLHQLDALQDKCHAAWAEYGFRVANLPEEMRERHERVHREAIERARAAGWDPELGEDE